MIQDTKIRHQSAESSLGGRYHTGMTQPFSSANWPHRTYIPYEHQTSVHEPYFSLNPKSKVQSASPRGVFAHEMEHAIDFSFEHPDAPTTPVKGGTPEQILRHRSNLPLSVSQTKNLDSLVRRWGDAMGYQMRGIVGDEQSGPWDPNKSRPYHIRPTEFRAELKAIKFDVLGGRAYTADDVTNICKGKLAKDSTVSHVLNCLDPEKEAALLNNIVQIDKPKMQQRHAMPEQQERFKQLIREELETVLSERLPD